MNDSGTMRIETNVSLRILGDDVDPEEITREMGIESDRAHKKGARIGQRTPAAQKQGYWTIVSSCHIEASAETNDHIRWLVAQAAPRTDVLRRYRGKGWLVDVWIGIHSDTGHGGPTLAPDVLAALADLGLEVNLDLYPDAND